MKEAGGRKSRDTLPLMVGDKNGRILTILILIYSTIFNNIISGSNSSCLAMKADKVAALVRFPGGLV